MSKQSHFPRVLIEIELDLEVISPLHIGTGERRELSSYIAASSASGQSVAGAGQVNAAGKSKVDDEPFINIIQRDGSGRPYLSGSTFKGLLRRLGELHNKENHDNALFGLIRNNAEEGEPTGQPGTLIVSGGSMIKAGNYGSAPFVDRLGNARGGVFVAARTRVDRESGTAANRALFHEELVTPGTIFRVKLEIDARARVNRSKSHDSNNSSSGAGVRMSEPQSPSAAACEQRCALADARSHATRLVEILAALTVKEGQQIGKGQADGAGAIRLHAIKTTGYRLETSGHFQPFLLKANGFPDLTKEALEKLAVATTSTNISLVCAGPFLVLDSSKKRERGQEHVGSRRPHLVAQRWRDNLPMILGYGISGSLASRVEWLAQVHMAINSRQFQRLWPDNTAGRAAVTPVDLLLGMTGFRGLMSLFDVRVHEAMPWDVTSVKIDRFTAGTIDDALFKTGAFIGGRIDFRLHFDERRATALERNASDLASRIGQARELLELLRTSIDQDGLQIGHGGNKGFGWFEPVKKGAKP